MRAISVGYGNYIASASNAKRYGPGDMDVALSPEPIYLRVNGTGVLSMLMGNGEQVDEDVVPGEILTVSPEQILSAGTTAVITGYW